MKMKSLIRRVTVALNIPTAVSNLIVFARAILLAMLNSPRYAVAAAKLSDLGTHIKVLEDAESACRTKPPTGSIVDRNKAKEEVKTDLRALCLIVQQLADADPENAMSIINDANMSVRNLPSHGKQKNTVEDGIETGSIELAGEGAGSHEWRMSLDDKTWIPLDASHTSKTIVTSLESGTIYYFQNRRMLPKKQKSEWSQSIKIRIK